MAEDMNNKSFHDMITGNKDRPTIRDARAVIDNATLRDSVDDALSRGLRMGHIVPYPPPPPPPRGQYIRRVREVPHVSAGVDHFQRPGVAQSMTVFEFDNGQWLEGRYIIGVRKHKTGANHPAVFSLSEEDQILFARYRTDVRRPMADEAMEKTDRALFFTTLGGKGYPSVSSELDKMQRKMGVRRVSSNAARHWMETGEPLQRQRQHAGRPQWGKRLPDAQRRCGQEGVRDPEIHGRQCGENPQGASGARGDRQGRG